MNEQAKKVKAIVKSCAEPSKFGSDPSDAWSAKSNVNEAGGLNDYLNSKGINPKFISKDAKISHAKSTQFLKWKKDHQFEEVEYLEEDGVLDTYLKSRGMNPATITKEKKISIAKSTAFIMWKQHHVNEGISTQHTPTQLRKHALNKAKHMNKPVKTDGLHQEAVKHQTALEKFRAAAAERAKKHAEIEKKQSKDGSGMTSAIDRLEKHLNKEETELEEALSKNDLIGKLQKSLSKVKKHKGGDLNAFTKGHHYTGARDPEDIDRMARRDTSEPLPTAKERAKIRKEETEQIDEISKSTLDSYRDKAMASNKNAKKNRDAAEPGKDMSKGFADLHAKSNAIVKKRIKGLSGYLQRKHGMKPGYEDQRKTTSEDVFADSQAATQSNFDGANAPDNTEPQTPSRKKEMSKSARIIKSIYKKKGVKEELYDHEKEDKSVASYGKKPKLQKGVEGQDQQSFGDTAPQAAAIMKGGKTLTGQTRDTLEIDPMMRRPLRPDQKQADINKKNKAN